MQNTVENIWSETRKLSRLEKMELVEKLVHQLRLEETASPIRPLNWEQMYGIGKGTWNIDAQVYVDSIREDR